MGIFFDESHRIFHLQSLQMSYAIQIVDPGYVAHLYWGKRLRSSNLSYLLQLRERAFAPVPDPQIPALSLDILPQEYPGYGNLDFRAPAYQLQLENGSTVMDLKYSGYEIVKGKPDLTGLPATYVENEAEATTLRLFLTDSHTSLQVVLSYTVYENFNVITRSANFSNHGTESLRLLRAFSANVDFPDADFDLTHLHGSWANEMQLERMPLLSGAQSIMSRRGASSHQHNPFLGLLRKDATEEQGEVFGFNLVYSGNFLAGVEVDQYRTTRVGIGINPFDFCWLLETGESFQTPEVVMVFSTEGLGGMSRTFHKLYRTRLCRGLYRDQERPVLINNWEATYFNFTADSMEQIVTTAGKLGIELFVLDDGWFGKRNDAKSSLGDWVVNRDKLPLGLADLVGRVNQAGLRFGLWFEPEMISSDSDLYREYPDWCLHVPGRKCSEGRNQLILDLSREEVCQAVIRMVTNILNSAPIDYVKWDMNRHMTEIGSAKLPPERQRETAHRYILNLYKIMDKITTAFPHILFESCSGGGGRFDPGILYYMPQTWTSDDTDAVARLKIQYGTSIVYPAIAMGAHVSAVPNHQLHRSVPLEMRGHVASSGNFGYELDLNGLNPAEQELVGNQVAFYKEIRHIVQFGDFYRIISPFEGNETAWIFVTTDKTEAVAFYFRVLAEPNPLLRRLRLKGLDPFKNYRIIGADQSYEPDQSHEIARIYGGDELMNAGINIPESKMCGDFQSICWRFDVI
jgi:alpha-galactosidase